jgi:heme-degrading monooxygenase HmoA
MPRPYRQAAGEHRIAAKGGTSTEEARVILSTVKVTDFDQFWKTFSTKGAALRKQHGSRAAHVFRDPNEPDRVWVVFDWDEDKFLEYIASPEAQEVFKEGGLQGRPVEAESAGTTDS